jgi:hypothetical protein
MAFLLPQTIHPDHTAPIVAAKSGSTPFAFENLKDKTLNYRLHLPFMVLK